LGLYLNFFYFGGSWLEDEISGSNVSREQKKKDKIDCVCVAESDTSLIRVTLLLGMLLKGSG